MITGIGSNGGIFMDNSIIVRFTADDGEEFELEVVQTVEYEDEFYAIMLPVDDGAEVFIMHEEEDGTYSTIEDEDILEGVFALFVETYGEMYGIEG